MYSRTTITIKVGGLHRPANNTENRGKAPKAVTKTFVGVGQVENICQPIPRSALGH